MWIQTKKLNRERVYTGLSFFGGRGPVWPGRGNTAALSPGPGSEHPAAWGRAPDSSPTMTEGAPQEVLAPERPSIVKSAALCPDVEPKEARWAATKSPGTPDLFFGLPIFWGPIRHSTLWRYTAR